MTTCLSSTPTYSNPFTEIIHNVHRLNAHSFAVIHLRRAECDDNAVIYLSLRNLKAVNLSVTITQNIIHFVLLLTNAVIITLTKHFIICTDVNEEKLL